MLLRFLINLKPPCNTGCATTRTVWATEGRVRECKHGRIWKCYRTFPTVDVGLWRKLSVIWNYNEYRDARQTLNLEKEETL